MWSRSCSMLCSSLLEYSKMCFYRTIKNRSPWNRQWSLVLLNLILNNLYHISACDALSCSEGQVCQKNTSPCSTQPCPPVAQCVNATNTSENKRQVRDTSSDATASSTIVNKCKCQLLIITTFWNLGFWKSVFKSFRNNSMIVNNNLFSLLTSPMCSLCYFRNQMQSRWIRMRIPRTMRWTWPWSNYSWCLQRFHMSNWPEMYRRKGWMHHRPLFPYP